MHTETETNPEVAGSSPSCHDACGGGRASLLNRLDALAIAVLVLLGFWFAHDSIRMPPVLATDAGEYFRLATDPSEIFRSCTISSQRIVPPTLVWAGGEILGLPLDVGFRFLADVSYLSFLVLFFLAMRFGGSGVAVSFGTTLFTAVSCWPMTYTLSNVYQACDAMAYPLGLAMILLTVRGNTLSLFLVSLVAAFTRQQLLLLGCSALLSLVIGRRDRLALACLVGLVGAFVAVVVLAGGSGRGLGHHTWAQLSNLGPLARGLREARLPLLFLPFPLVLVWFWPGTWRLAVKYWWVVFYMVATMIQPLLAYDFTGPSNAQRLAAMGVWPAFLAAGWIIGARLTIPWAKAAYVALPLLYGTRHLTHLQHTYTSPVGHRVVVAVLLLVLVLAGSRRERSIPRIPVDGG